MRRSSPTALDGWLVAALLLAAWPGPSRAGQPPLVGAIAVRAQPERLTLGEGASATLAIEAPADLDGLELTCSVGTVEAVERVGPGRFQARYVPPSKRYPQVALVSATGRVGDTPHQGWTVIGLWGQGDAVIHTRPGASISVRIADAVFGPATANDRGIAVVPIVVPPGVREGFHGKRPIDLGLPQVPHVHVALERRRALADRQEELTVWAYAVTAAGEPRGGAPLILETDRGALTEPREVAPGVVQARWRLEPGAAGEARLSAKLIDEPGFAASAPLELVPGPTARLELVVDRERHLAGGEPVAVTATAFDEAGNRTRDGIELEAHPGPLVVDAAEPGRLQARIEVPANFEGASALELSASAGEAAATRSLPLVPGPVATIELTPADALVVADGRSSVALVARPLDRFGNLVSDAELQPSAQLGAVALAPPAGAGRRLVYRAPPLHADGADLIEVRAGAVGATSRIALEPAHRLLTLAPKIGVAREGPRIAPHFGAEAGYHFDGLGHEFAALLDLGYFGISRAEEVSGLTLRGEQSFTALTVSLTWRRRFGERWLFWAGVGVGAGFVSSTLRAGEQPPTSETGVAFAGQVIAGVGRRMWRGGPFLEARLLEQSGADLANLTGRLSALLFDLGYRFEAL
ncbi:MAG: outer membrane protein [Myxococcales bacterium]|jgi:hypothetical protein